MKHWIKNLFILIPLFFSAQLFNYDKLIETSITIFGFCLVTGFIYIINDIFDMEFDKLHPKKKLRPIAAKNISIKKALIIGTSLLVLGLLVIYKINKISLLWTLFYVFMNVLYSYKLKNIAIIDFVIVSLGFVIRLYIGSSVSEIQLSEWIILMVFLLSLFISTSKRRDDVILLEKTKNINRAVITQYSTAYLDNIISIVTSILLVCYLMFVTDDLIKIKYNSNLIYMTFIFVLIGIFRYSQLSIVYKIGGSPIQIFYKDHYMQLILFLWVLSFFIIIY